MLKCDHGDCFSCPYPDCTAIEKPVRHFTKRPKATTEEERKKRIRESQRKYVERNREMIRAKQREYYYRKREAAKL